MIQKSYQKENDGAEETSHERNSSENTGDLKEKPKERLHKE